MNLLNLVDTRAPGAVDAVPEAVQKSWGSAVADQEHAKWTAARAGSRSIDRLTQEWVTKVLSEADEAVEGLCWQSFLTDSQLPIPMQAKASPVLKKMTATPRAPLGSILDAVTKLGFVIIPFDYLDPRAYKAEGHEMTSAICEFGKLHGWKEPGRYSEGEIVHPKRMDVYVACPPTYYSLERHLASDDPNQPIYGGKNDHAFMALTFTIPTLRAMKVQIKVLEENQRELQRGQRNLTDAVTALSAQVTAVQNDVNAQLGRMQKQIEGTIRETVREAVETAAALGNTAGAAEAKRVLDALGQAPTLKDASAALARLESIKFSVLEPMMFALPPGAGLQARNTLAMIGPCWGPDFADIIAVAVGLTPDADRRKNAEQMLQTWGIYRQRDTRRDVEADNLAYREASRPAGWLPRPRW